MQISTIITRPSLLQKLMCFLCFSLTAVTLTAYTEPVNNPLVNRQESEKGFEEEETRAIEKMRDKIIPGDKTEANPENLTVAELIEKLVEVSEEGIGFHSTAWASAFIATEDGAEFGGGVLGSRKPVVSPAMRELVKRGIEAIPELIEHLSDTRETKITVGDTGFHTAMWHSDEYDPRYADPSLHPVGVNKVGHDFTLEREVGQYTLRVGDLCYVAIGQIVNRRLNAVRYQPTACLVINSPVETSELAEAVKKDWSGLTPEQHKNSLLADTMDKSSLRFSEGAKRLLFYYQIDVMEALKVSPYRCILSPWGVALLFGIVLIVILVGLFLAKRSKQHGIPHV